VAGWLPVIDATGFHMPGYPEGLNASVPEIFAHLPVIGFGICLLALGAAFLQLIQTRMAQTKTDDPQIRVQNRTMLILPAISIVYGAFLPAGLFLYWITTTIFSIIQQYVIAGWGALFPATGLGPCLCPQPQTALSDDAAAGHQHPVGWSGSAQPAIHDR
jgi:hypothetical protein